MAQGLVGFLSGRAKQDNFVYRLFLVVTAPVIKFTRLISPKYIADQHMGIASFFSIMDRVERVLQGGRAGVDRQHDIGHGHLRASELIQG